MTHPPHMQHRRHDPDEPVFSITDATESHSSEMRTRMVKYTISMSIRLVCFIAAFFTSGPLQWIFLAGAIFLPWFAVVVANGGADRRRQTKSTSLLDAAPATALDGPATGSPHHADGSNDGGGDRTGHAEDTPDDDTTVILEGEFVEDEPRPRSKGDAA